MHSLILAPLAIEGAFRLTTNGKRPRRFDWYSEVEVAPAVPRGWRPTRASTEYLARGHVHGVYWGNQTRVLSCAAGRVALAAVDIRVGAPTFGRWVPEELDASHRTAVVLTGVGWAYQALTDDAVLVSLYAAEPSATVIDPLDETLGLVWPLAPVTSSSGKTSASVARAELPVYRRG